MRHCVQSKALLAMTASKQKLEFFAPVSDLVCSDLEQWS